MHSSLKKGLSWTLSYGIIFSFPAWALLSRIAHAATDDGVSTTAPASKPAQRTADAAKPDTKPAAASTDAHKATATPKKTASSKPEPHQLESDEPTREGKKGDAAPKVTNCSDKKMLQVIAYGQPNDPGPRCDQPTSNINYNNPKCWQQVFMLLGAARTNGLVANNSLDTTRAAQQAAAWTVSEGNIIKPNVFNAGKASSNGPKEDELKTIFTRMADESIKDKKQCCKQLVMQAVDLSQWILKKSKEEGSNDTKIHDKIHDLYNKQGEDCDKAQKDAAAPVAGFVAPAEKHASQAPEKKKSIWPAIFWGLAAGALVFFLLFKRKKKSRGNPPPTPPTPPTTTTTGGTGGTTYPVLTTTSTGRDITTGGTGTTGGLTYPADTTGATGGRDITTGGTGTVTGSTTATTTTSTSTTTGGTTATPAYPDLSTSGTSRTTSGTTRTIK